MRLKLSRIYDKHTEQTMRNLTVTWPWKKYLRSIVKPKIDQLKVNLGWYLYFKIAIREKQRKYSTLLEVLRNYKSWKILMFVNIYPSTKMILKKRFGLTDGKNTRKQVVITKKVVWLKFRLNDCLFDFSMTLKTLSLE